VVNTSEKVWIVYIPAFYFNYLLMTNYMPQFDVRFAVEINGDQLSLTAKHVGGEEKEPKMEALHEHEKEKKEPKVEVLHEHENEKKKPKMEVLHEHEKEKKEPKMEVLHEHKKEKATDGFSKKKV
jgi:hypothetical protein